VVTEGDAFLSIGENPSDLSSDGLHDPGIARSRLRLGHPHVHGSLQIDPSPQQRGRAKEETNSAWSPKGGRENRTDSPAPGQASP
jgi:hypothetical protein